MQRYFANIANHGYTMTHACPFLHPKIWLLTKSMVRQQCQRNRKCTRKTFEQVDYFQLLALFPNNYPCYFQKYTHFQDIFTNIENIFKKTNIFVYILTNENHYKDFLNEWLLLQNTFKKPHKAQFSNKSKLIQQVTKSPWKTTDEKDANTFPFHNLPPELKKTSQRSFLCFFTFPFG